MFSRAPTDCVQWFTGKTGAVKSYNFAGSQMLQSQIYNNCIRTEKGYCAIQWKESSTTSPDPFQVSVKLESLTDSGLHFDFDFVQVGSAPTSAIGANGATATLCPEFILIPNLSQENI